MLPVIKSRQCAAPRQRCRHRPAWQATGPHLEKAKQEKDAEKRRVLQKELKEYLKAMEVKQAVEARQLLKERFDYPIFMYEAEKVGISATGDEDLNELYPNPNQPADCEKTCLEWYREFLSDPIAFAAAG